MKVYIYFFLFLSLFCSYCFFDGFILIFFFFLQLLNGTRPRMPTPILYGRKPFYLMAAKAVARRSK